MVSAYSQHLAKIYSQLRIRGTVKYSEFTKAQQRIIDSEAKRSKLVIRSAPGGDWIVYIND